MRREIPINRYINLYVSIGSFRKLRFLLASQKHIVERSGARRKKKKRKKRTVPKLFKVNRATLIRIKHSNHHANGIRIKLGPVTIDQSILQFSLAEMTTIIAIDSSEQRPQSLTIVTV